MRDFYSSSEYDQWAKRRDVLDISNDCFNSDPQNQENREDFNLDDDGNEDCADDDHVVVDQLQAMMMTLCSHSRWQTSCNIIYLFRC